MKIIASLLPILCLSSSIVAQDMNLHAKEIDYSKYFTKVYPEDVQDTVHYQEDKFGKNTFYISGMIPIASNSYVLVNYEHIINKNPYKFPLLLVRIAGGFHIVGGHHQSSWLYGPGLYVEPYTNTTILNTLSILVGRNLLHLELSAGYCFYFWDDINELTSSSRSPQILPQGGIGVRYQKPGRTIIFRVGLALPIEGLYLGFGGAF